MILNASQQQRLSLGSLALLALLVIFTFSFSLWQWRNDWVLAHPANLSISTPTTSETALLVASIPANHLFGQSLTGGSIPISSLQLHVTGIVKTDDATGENASKAYISSQGQPSKIYQKGDSLPYGVKVYDIADNAVILENDGQLEKLPLQRTPLEFKPPLPEEDF